ncbi:MAG: hypothetical protein WCS51_02350 [Bacilli bacterium]|jgi:AcrR family transcriptional regulator
MVNTENEIQKTFISLSEKYEFNEIDVNMICKALDIKRQTFYYHFKNIYDVIFSIYCYQKIQEPYENDMNSLIRNIFTFLYSDQAFNKIIAKSNASDVLTEFVGSYINNGLTKILNRYNLRLEDKKDILRFFSKGLSEQCLYYFAQAEYGVNDATSRVSYIFNDDVLRTIIRKYQNSIE